MSHRDHMLAAIRGEETNSIPWAPRLDLWYIARRARGDLPPELEGLDTPALADYFGVACHSVRADYTRARPREDLILRGFGLDNHPDYPFRTELRGLPCTFEHDDENARTTIETRSGPVHTHLHQTSAMSRDGISLPFFRHHALESIDRIEAVAEVFDHIEVVPMPESYRVFKTHVGERGIAVSSGPIAASPMHLILHELAAMDQFFYHYADHLAKLEALCEHIEPYFEAVLDALVASEAEVVLWGGNYDQDLTWPPFFARYIRPWLQRAAERLHAAGKFLLTHTDGENKDLLSLYPDCHFDIAESVCPQPMTQCTLAEVRKGMGENVTVWGGIPSVALLTDAMDDAAFTAYIDEIFAEIGDRSRLILGVSDNVPPDADMERLRYIGERCAAGA
ncbi:MAG: hypothetical protein ACI8PG_004554 [Planctomycetota bacterium]|jgi:hypothetical protein